MSNSLAGPLAKSRWKVSAPSARSLLIGLVLAGLLFCGGLLRLWHVDWDEGQHLHPDERFLSMVTDDIRVPGQEAPRSKLPDGCAAWGGYFNSRCSPLSPYNTGKDTYVYGTFPLFLTKAIAILTHYDTYDLLYLVGRCLSALFDLGTVLLLYFVGRQLYGRKVGLLASILATFTTFEIQNSHFFTMESFTLFFVVLAFWFAVRIAQGKGLGNYAGAGLAFGLAMACKTSVAYLLLVMIAAALLALAHPLTVSADTAQAVVGNKKRASESLVVVRRARRKRWLYVGGGTLLAACATILTFRIAQPYAFEGTSFWSFKPSAYWIADIGKQKAYVDGVADYPPSHQYAFTTPYLFPLKDMLLWGFGMPLGVAAWLGFGAACYGWLWRGRVQHALVCLWLGFNFYYYGGVLAKGMRYYLPMYPFLILMAAWLLVRLWERSRSRGTVARWGARLAVASVVGGTLLWALAFVQIYTRPNTRVAASRWIYAHVPPKATIANEDWDDALPLRVDGKYISMLGYQSLKSSSSGMMSQYDSDFERDDHGRFKKPARLLNWLSETQYIVLSSNRLYGSIPRLPLRYPLTTEYYRLLFNGQLGFDVVYRGESQPSLLGVTINDNRGPEGLGLRWQPDETFTIYDHTSVLIFKKRPDFSRAHVAALISRVNLDEALDLRPIQAMSVPQGVFMTGAQRAQQEPAGTWSVLFPPDSPVNKSGMVAALIWWLWVQVFALVALPLTWVGLRHLPDRGYLLAKPLALLLSAYLVWLGVSVLKLPFVAGTVWGSWVAIALLSALVVWPQRRELLPWMRAHARLIALNEALFGALYSVFLVLRALNPDVWRPSMLGSPPVDYAYLEAVAKSIALPACDPGLAGGLLNVPTFGYALLANGLKVTHIAPPVAYNLALPLLLTLTATGAHCVIYNLAASFQSRLSTDSSGATARLSPFRYGLVGVLLVAVIGDRAGVWGWRDTTQLPLETTGGALPLVALLAGHLRSLLVWPFALLAVGASLNSLRALAGEEGVWDKGHWKSGRFTSAHGWIVRVLPLVVLGWCLGALRPLEPLYFPTFLLLGLAFLGLGLWLRRQGEGEDEARRTTATVLGGIVFVLIFRFAAGLSTELSVLVGGGVGALYGRALGRTAVLLAASVAALSLALFQPFGTILTATPQQLDMTLDLSGWGNYSLACCCYFGIVAGWAFSETLLNARTGQKSKASRASKSRERREDAASPEDATRPENAACIARSVAFALMASGSMVMLVALLLLRREPDRPLNVLAIQPQIVLLWSLGAVAFLPVLEANLRALHQEYVGVYQGVLKGVVIVALVTAFLSANLWRRDRYVSPIALVPTPTEPSLDGAAFIQGADTVWLNNPTLEPVQCVDKGAVTWMQRNVEGSARVAEAGRNEGLPHATNVAYWAGLPALLGFSPREEELQAPLDQVAAGRDDQVKKLFETTNTREAIALLRKLDVDYVCVGKLERDLYPPQGLAKFDLLSEQGLNLVYKGETRIYHFVPPGAKR